MCAIYLLVLPRDSETYFQMSGLNVPWGLKYLSSRAGCLAAKSSLRWWARLVCEMERMEEGDVPGQYSKEECILSGHALGLQKPYGDRSLNMLHTAQETKSVWGSLCA